LTGAIGAAITPPSLVHYRLPFVALLAKPPDPLIRRWGYSMRGQAAVFCGVPMLGYLGVYDCEVVIGSELCHPPGASSV
jgi:hypothetical protein